MPPLRILIWTAVSTRVQSKEDRLSLPIQEQDGRRFAVAENGTVVDVLTVPGHTRRLLDWEELKRRARRKGIDAFAQLEDHWKVRDFDVLWVRGGDRFARSQAVHARVTEEIIQAGMRIYAADEGGWVDKTNYRMWIAMSGMTAASSVDRLVLMGRKAKDEKAAVGLAINSRPIWSHKVARSELGRIVAVEADESKRLVIEDAARLVVEGVGWHHVERDLYARYGHANGGQPFTHHFFYNLFHNPYFWGNSARRWKHPALAHGRQWDVWIFNASMPAPDGVLIYYGTHPAYLRGDLADRLMAELLRRRSSIRGSTRPYRSRAFSGLLVCGECFYFMNWTDNGHGTGYYRCTPSANPGSTKRDCPGQFVREDAVQRYFEKALKVMLAERDPYYFFRDDDAVDDTTLIRTQLDRKRDEARTLIRKQARADAALSSLYDEQLETLAGEMKALETRLVEAERDLDLAERATAERAYQELEALPDPAQVWTWEPTRINQFLHRLMGRHRLLVLGKKVERVIRR